MRILEDRRPTLASWPKRIYDWSELPEKFRPALEAWRAEGLLPGNVTYIPKVHQYSDSAEFATAWLGCRVLLQTGGSRGTELFSFQPEEVAQVDYQVQLLRCTVSVALGAEREGARSSFSYNKTKEDQLLPVLNLALGNPADYVPQLRHPAQARLEQLRADSYAMYNTSKLCYRFGEKIVDFLWLQGRNRGLSLWRRQRPEYFLSRMERGLVTIQTDFYGTRISYLPWQRLKRAGVAEAHGHPLVSIEGEGGAVRFPLETAQREAAEHFFSL